MSVEFAYISTTAAEEWRQWHGRNIEVRDTALGLATEPTINYRNLRVAAVDISIDQDGNVLVLTGTGDIEQHDPEERHSTTVWENGEGATLDEPRALCVFGDRLYVLDGASGDLVILSRRAEAVIGNIEARLDDPVDIIRSNQRIYILDRGTEDVRGRILTLGRNGRVETVVRGLASPSDITADSSHLYCIEQRDGKPIIRIHDVKHVDSPNVIPTSRTVDELAVPEGDPVRPVRIEVLTDQELVVIGERADDDGRVLYHYTLDRRDGTLERRDDFPLPCSKLLTGPRDQSRRYPKYYAIAGERNHVYIVDERQTNRRNSSDGRYSAQAFRRFDSGAIDTGWNRLTLDFETFPANTQVVTSYYATNEAGDSGRVENLDGVSTEDATQLREAAIEGVWDLLETDARTVADIVGDESTSRVEEWRDAAVSVIEGQNWVAADSANQRDILLEDVFGQYLHVKLEIVGGIDASPEVGSFRAYCPKQTYLRYLPEQYQAPGPGERFLERYLSIFESEFVDIEEKIERIARYFDPEGVPNEYLSWLSNWLAIEYDDEWPAEAKREFLVQAPSLFKQRGTKAGMERTVRLYLNHVDTPDTSWMGRWRRQRLEARHSDGRMADQELGTALRQIEEQTTGYDPGHLLFFYEHLNFDGMTADSARQPYTMYMEGPRSFVVFIGPFVNRAHRDAVERIVGREKPAHTHGRVVEIRQELKLEGGSFLGINSTLTTREFVLGRATLGGDTVLKERETVL